jgi:hypothetical protein
MQGEHRVSLDPNDFRGVDLFPDVSEEIDRRIQHSEQRIKTWVLGGIAANLLVAILAAIPTIFYMGQISRDINQAIARQTEQQAELIARGKWMNERMIWEARIEAALERENIRVSERKIPE